MEINKLSEIKKNLSNTEKLKLIDDTIEKLNTIVNDKLKGLYFENKSGYSVVHNGLWCKAYTYTLEDGSVVDEEDYEKYMKEKYKKIILDIFTNLNELKTSI